MPNITTLAFTSIFDLSGSLPSISLMNTSTGSNLGACTWWVTVALPDGTMIHQGSISLPDMSGAWGTWTMPEVWPRTNGHVQWSGAPYIITLYVDDGNGTSLNLAQATEIKPPCGNGGQATSNFGNGSFVQEVKCDTQQVYVLDQTNYLYNSSVGELVTQSWTMRYPPSPVDGNRRADSTITGAGDGYLPISYNGNGYTIYMESVRDYDVAVNAIVRIRYKAQHQFNVQCNIEFCQLVCCYEMLVKKTEGNKNVDPYVVHQLEIICSKLNMVLIGINSGCTNVEISPLMNDVKRIMNKFGCSFNNCDDNGVNAESFPVGNTTIIVPVIDGSTGDSPIECPGAYFPVYVYKPDGVTVIALVNNVLELIAAINSTPEWQYYGRAVYIGDNCKVGFIANDGILTIPDIIVTRPQADVLNIIDGCTGVAPVGCPGSYFPCVVYAPNGTTAIGAAGSIYDVISLMNGYGPWAAYGTASYNSANCSIKFVKATGVTSVPAIKITTGSCCVANTQNYIIPITDSCSGGTITSFPFSASVNYGSGPHSIGTVTSLSDLITKLNADPLKPSVVTYAAGSPGSVNLLFYNANCTTFSFVVTITGSMSNYLLYGANNEKQTLGFTGGEWGIGLASNVFIGKIPGSTGGGEYAKWHTILIDNGTKMLVTQDTNSGTYKGRVFVYDVSVPLMPVALGMIMLTTIVGNNFQGIPNFEGRSWLYSLVFPTDTNKNMSDANVFVVEALTGTIWKLNVATMTVLDGFQDQRLQGLIPRVLKADGEKIFYTADGHLKLTAGGPFLPSVVITVNTATFATHAGSIGQFTLYANVGLPTYPIAASFDGTYIWFLNDYGSLYRYEYSTGTIIGVIGAVPGGVIPGTFALTGFANMKWWNNNRLYVSSSTIGSGYIDISAWPTVSWHPFDPLVLPGVGAPNVYHYNFLPLDNCKGVLTFSDATGHASGIAMYDLDGHFISLLRGSVEFYNVVPIPNIAPPYSPTTLI